MTPHQDKPYHHIPVLIGATDFLVKQRKLVQKYHTNREIKTWSFYFLLKSLTSSGHIQHWIKQREDLLSFTQCNEQTFRSRINELKRMGLLTIGSNYTLVLAGFKAAARVMGIAYQGTTLIPYDPNNDGKQSFQYFIASEEFRHNQERQLEALHQKIDKNPLLAQSLYSLLYQAGANGQRLNKDAAYYQEQLLRLQLRVFKEGSAIYDEVMAVRADINRGIRGIKKAYNYICERSAGYLRTKLKDLGIIHSRVRTSIKSEVRSRLYYEEQGQRKERYRWLPDTYQTQMQLCDQLSFNYKKISKKNETENFTAAA